MTAKSYLRGHEIVFNDASECWCWADTGEPTIGEDRSCGRCGKDETEEGHDACIAKLPGVVNACCGHGQNEGYISFEDGRVIYMNITGRWDKGKEYEEINKG